VVNRTPFLALFAVVACSGEPRFPAPPAVLGTAAKVSESPAQELQQRTFDWVLAGRWTIDKSLVPVVETDAVPIAIVRAFHSGLVLGVVRCDATCVGALKTVLPDGAERAHLEQRILRATEHERVDGLALDLGGLAEVDAAASAMIDEIGAVLHLANRKLGVIMQMTCRDAACTGMRLLGRVARAADLVVVTETDEDVVDGAARADARRRAIAETLSKGPTARVFLEAGSEERAIDAHALGLGGLYVDLTSPSRAVPEVVEAP
jgi:hypothetical protein